jgi:hypothetical protein
MIGLLSIIAVFVVGIPLSLYFALMAGSSVSWFCCRYGRSGFAEWSVMKGIQNSMMSSGHKAAPHKTAWSPPSAIHG